MSPLSFSSWIPSFCSREAELMPAVACMHCCEYIGLTSRCPHPASALSHDLYAQTRTHKNAHTYTRTHAHVHHYTQTRMHMHPAQDPVNSNTATCLHRDRDCNYSACCTVSALYVRRNTAMGSREG
eukprot:1160241-Pelagomonas_calceolata.AAC.1